MENKKEILTKEMSKKGYIKCNNCGEVFKPENVESEKFYLFKESINK